MIFWITIELLVRWVPWADFTLPCPRWFWLSYQISYWGTSNSTFSSTRRWSSSVCWNGSFWTHPSWSLWDLGCRKDSGDDAPLPTRCNGRSKHVRTWWCSSQLLDWGRWCTGTRVLTFTYWFWSCTSWGCFRLTSNSFSIIIAYLAYTITKIINNHSSILLFFMNSALNTCWIFKSCLLKANANNFDTVRMLV